LGERCWLTFYAVAAFIYRLFIMVAISIFVASKFFFIGVVLALWSVAYTVLLPLIRGLRFLISSPRLRRRRSRALSMTGGAAALAAALIFLVPVPYATIAEGVVWAPESAQIRTRTEGEITRLLAAPNDLVSVGTPLIELQNPELTSRLKMLGARRLELETQLEANIVKDRVQVQMIRAQINHIESAVKDAQDEVDGLVVRAAADGVFVLSRADDFVGRYVHKGHQLGVLAQTANHTVRVVLSQDDVDLVRQRTRLVQIRLANDLTRTSESRVTASTPAAVTKLPSSALSTRGGGRILTHPEDKNALTPLETVFEFDLRLSDSSLSAPPGLRAFVRFDHGYEPIGWRMIRSVRQLFLAVFLV
jgi:putative peptide zinc metalloprotease protein